MNTIDFYKLRIIQIEKYRAWSYCPFHNDVTRPNLSISLDSNYYGRYKCWTCGKEGKLTTSQMQKLNIPKAACSLDVSDGHIQWHAYIENCIKNLQKYPLLKLALAKQLNVSLQSLSDWFVGYDGESYIIPMLKIGGAKS